jgi:competence protein ComEC
VLVAAAATALTVFIPVRAVTSQWPPPGWVFVACDVGQGDALVLRAAGDAAVLVDAGPDPVPVDRCLRDLGVERLPLVALTHLHLDHVGGVPGAVRGRAVGRVITGPLGEPETGAAIVRGVTARLGHPATTPAIGTHY